MALLSRAARPPVWLGLVVAASLILVESVVVLLLKRVAPGDAFGVLYLVGVLVVSGVWGFGLSAAMSVASAVAFDYFRTGPAAFTLTRVEDWAVIGIFLIVALVATTLAQLARTRAVEAEHSRDALRAVADLQASLRRVATLVAHGVAPSEVFCAVADELALCLGVRHTTLFRFEPDGAGLLIAGHHEFQTELAVGKRFSLDGESVAAMIFRTGRPARMDDHDDAPGPAADYIRRLGMRSGVGVPIMVDGRVWGAAIVGSSQPDPLPPDTESRVGEFADLVTTAIANAETHAQLTASRARIVAAGDEARRRFERDLHDGAQQRLVTLGLRLRAAEASVPPDLGSVREQLAEIVDGLTGVSTDLQEISRGIHPAILSRGGLGPALKTLARRSGVPVALRVAVDQRLPDSVEVAAYYVVAESLTNAAKYAQASEVRVTVETDGPNVRLSIRDDGIGGADAGRGSGLTGLTDRVEALGGQLRVSSPVGSGTSLLATIPF
ncbi:sensor histidine kinase [Mycobacterium parmense]|uniref:sensor histidine kinase n=1 Tax=Mycobacterium parmense TaxID=185642 RepID=UPI000A2405D8|nr:GAF domain-containing protein [Mycobacterium parmense]ORW56331.1 histidine kinase [Mycobacterium parmense]